MHLSLTSNRGPTPNPSPQIGDGAGALCIAQRLLRGDPSHPAAAQIVAADAGEPHVELLLRELRAAATNTPTLGAATRLECAAAAAALRHSAFLRRQRALDAQPRVCELLGDGAVAPEGGASGEHLVIRLESLEWPALLEQVGGLSLIHI